MEMYIIETAQGKVLLYPVQVKVGNREFVMRHAMIPMRHDSPIDSFPGFPFFENVVGDFDMEYVTADWKPNEKASKKITEARKRFWELQNERDEIRALEKQLEARKAALRERLKEFPLY